MPTIAAKDATVQHAEAFELSEASVRLEGMDPTRFPVYLELKARILAGEITSQQAIDILFAHYSNAHTAAA